MKGNPLPPGLRFLIEAERSRPDAPAEAKALAQTKLASLLGPAAGMGGTGSAGPDGNGANTPGTGPAVGAAQGAIGSSFAKLTAAFVLGGIVGGGVATAVVRPEERVIFVDREVPVASSPAPVVTSLPSPADVPRRDSPAPPTSPPPAPPTSGVYAASSASPAPVTSATGRSRDTDLAAERALVERARSALSRGDGAGAYVAVEQHGRDFPRGQLIEEREVLAVQALVAVGRVQEAAERGARFRKAFPKSFLLPVVDQALR